MKKLLIPVLIAVLAGVGGGSGFAYMRASKAFVVDSTHMADSLKAHPPAKHDTTTEAPVLAPVVEAPPMTPADSIRALEASRAASRDSNKGVPAAADPQHAPAPSAVDPKHAAPVVPAAVPPAAAAHADTPKPSGATASVADIVREARNDAMSTALPEQRLSKIFSAMSAKDAAKVMEQMPDSDIRAILAMMSDRTAAAVLSQFQPARAASITKGSARAPEKKP